jgi:hypothetical protein
MLVFNGSKYHVKPFNVESPGRSLSSAGMMKQKCMQRLDLGKKLFRLRALSALGISVIADAYIRVTVHHSDTVSVVIGCSFSPVAVDIDGIIRLSNALTLIHDRLQRLTKDCNSDLVIPNHMNWIVTMWHFGADSSILYKGKSFHVSWKVAENALIAFYSKVWKDGKCRVRGERQEYPRKPLDEALDEKLNLIGGVKEIVHNKQGRI